MRMTGSDQSERAPSEGVDVCVVGAGVAGGLVAHRLADRGYDVVMLEAGKRFDRSKDRYRMERTLRPTGPGNNVWEMGGRRDAYSSSGEFDYPLNETRVKGVGGTTLHWLGITPRLHREDFEMDSRYGLADDWPIDYETLQPYYASAERALGVAGRQDNPFAPPRATDYPMEAFPQSPSDAVFEAACDELGIDLHTVPQARNSEVYDGRSQCLGYSTCVPVCPSGAKYSGDVHVEKAESLGARIIDRVPVQWLEHDDAGDRVTAAVYRTPDGKQFRQSARHFVVAAGAVETARLLLLSRSEQYPDGLANSSGAVGHFFLEHPSIEATGSVAVPPNPNPIGFHTSESHQFYDTDAPGQGSLKLEFRNADPPPFPELATRGGDEGTRGDLSDVLTGDAWGAALVQQLREASDQRTRLTIRATAEQLPRWDNTVALDHTQTDEFGNPVPELSFTVGDHARGTLDYASGVLEDIMSELGATDVSVDAPSEPIHSSHHMGTTRMGTDPNESVVDARLRTHDLTNLTIASGGAFVTAGAMNPTLTIAALSLKAAEHIAADL